MTMPSSDVRARIAENAQAVRAAATELTKRIRTFETWLSKLPGRVTAEVCTDDDGDWQTYLAFRRYGSEWALVVYDYHPSGNETDLQLLRDAPVETKVRMVNYFGGLVEAFAKRQVEVAKLARESSRTFDVIVEPLGIKEGE